MKPVLIIKTDAHEDGEGLLNEKVYSQHETLKHDLSKCCNGETFKDTLSCGTLETMIDRCNSGEYIFLDDMRFALLVVRIV